MDLKGLLHLIEDRLLRNQVHIKEKGDPLQVLNYKENNVECRLFQNLQSHPIPLLQVELEVTKVEIEIFEIIHDPEGQVGLITNDHQCLHKDHGKY